MKDRLNQDSDTSDTDAQQVRQPAPTTADSSQKARDWADADAPPSGDDVQSNPVIINR